MLRLARVFRTFTSITFIALLLITYAYSIEKENVFVDAEKTVSVQLETLFFIFLSLFIFVSLLFLILDRFIVSYRKRKNISTGILGGDKFRLWLHFFQASVQILLAGSFVFIGFLNSDEGMKLLNYSFFLYLGPIVVLLTLLSLPWVFFSKSAS